MRDEGHRARDEHDHADVEGKIAGLRSVESPADPDPPTVAHHDSGDHHEQARHHQFHEPVGNSVFRLSRLVFGSEVVFGGHR
jgi:hypothetical protein